MAHSYRLAAGLVVGLSAAWGSAAEPAAPAADEPAVWKDPAQPLDARVADLIHRMTLDEKIQQIRNATPAIPRLGIPGYNFWNEALHGVAKAGVATVFPQAIGMAAAWDPVLVHQEADVISTEGRAKFNDYTAHHHGDAAGRYGLTFWSPNINIFRDPRWGRGQETYGEDPYLTGTLAVQFIHGLQGDDPRWVKVMACAKHFAVHSGPEAKRHRFDATPPERDLYETYLPQFEMAVREGQVDGVMGAYNALYGVPACASPFLLQDLLRKQWGFKGYIVSDCPAIHDIFEAHKFVPTQVDAVAVAINTGCDICCGKDYNVLQQAVADHKVAEAQIDEALGYALRARFKLGMFDPPELVPFSKIGMDQNDSPAHEALALKVAEESIVLLKNEGVLPLDRAKVRRIAVIGSNAESVPALTGSLNYAGVPARPVSLLAGIKAVAGPSVKVTYSPGCPLALKVDQSNQPTPEMTEEALADARAADVIVYVGGISPEFEGEEMKRANGFVGFSGGDRTQIELPEVQTSLLKALAGLGKPVVFVNCSGSAIAMPWEAANLPAIVQAWYPGEQGGRAVAEVLWGEVNPAGRLPITFYRSTSELPNFEDYSMKNRTYRYFEGKPLFAFGHGLSYSTFAYSHAAMDVTSERASALGLPAVALAKERATRSTLGPDDRMNVHVTVRNTGTRAGDEVVQIYFRHIDSAVPQPRLQLCAFQRIHLEAGESRAVAITVPAQRLRSWETARKTYVVEKGGYELLVGAGSDDIRQTLPIKIAGGPDQGL